jgi:DNA-binding response OmpR family regulator
MRILLVDDEVEFVTTLAERLTLRGFAVDHSVTAAEAFDLAKRTRYDLAVLDMKMPGTSGLELQAQLAQLQPNLRFIFLTGHGSEDDYSAGRQQADHYLVKPVDINVLIAKINQTVLANDQH